MIKLLSNLSANSVSPLIVIILRADFYAHCARFDRLRQALLAEGPWTLLYDEGGVQIYRLGGVSEASR